ncbi:MAG: CdaR family protein [Verrucomicrobiota bacterium]
MSIRAFIQHNFWLKLFSFVLATLIWFAIHYGIRGDFRLPQNPITTPTTREFSRLPVRILSRSGDTNVFTVVPAYIYVQVTGEAAVLANLNPQNIAVYVDLANVRSLEETNQQVRLDFPDGVTIIKVAPRAVNVELVSP